MIIIKIDCIGHSQMLSDTMQFEHLDTLRCYAGERVKGEVTTTKIVKLPPLGSIEIKGVTYIRGQSKHIKLIVEPPERGFSSSLFTTNTYTEIKPGSCRVGICLCNLLAWEIQIQAHTVVGQIQAANKVPHVIAPKCLGEKKIKHQIRVIKRITLS